MNFLAHLYLADGEDELMLGALLGDFVRGRLALYSFAPEIRRGIRLHRRIDKVTDRSPEVRNLKRLFPREFRRYAGIVIDLAFDHELARRWPEFSNTPLTGFDGQVRDLLLRNHDLLPGALLRFMKYADRRGLFAAYRFEEEMLHSLAGIGTRLKRANPLHRVGEIWPDLKDEISAGFESFFPAIQSEVSAWRNRRSTTTGS